MWNSRVRIRQGVALSTELSEILSEVPLSKDTKLLREGAMCVSEGRVVQVGVTPSARVLRWDRAWCAHGQ